MKREFSGKRPVMFYQPGDGTTDLVKGDRVRIFYPDGNIEWASLGWDGDETLNTYLFTDHPCYLQNRVVTPQGSVKWVDFKPDNMEHALALAEKFDEEEGFPKMIFLGEL